MYLRTCPVPSLSARTHARTDLRINRPQSTSNATGPSGSTYRTPPPLPAQSALHLNHATSLNLNIVCVSGSSELSGWPVGGGVPDCSTTLASVQDLCQNITDEVETFSSVPVVITDRGRPTIIHLNLLKLHPWRSRSNPDGRQTDSTLYILDLTVCNYC